MHAILDGHNSIIKNFSDFVVRIDFYEMILTFTIYTVNFLFEVNITTPGLKFYISIPVALTFVLFLMRISSNISFNWLSSLFYLFFFLRVETFFCKQLYWNQEREFVKCNKQWY